ncbi:MAG: hypothetical protein ACPG4U_10285 [Pseudomonadales bacterium]
MELKSNLIEVLQGEDDLGVVIRSHIVVEQYLNSLIESRMASVAHYQKIKMDYHGTVKLAIALGLNPRFEKALNVLGTLRNDFAHNLRPEISLQDANNLYQTLNSEDKQVLQKCLKKTLKQLPDEDISQYQALKPKDKYILNVIVICGALETACRQILNNLSQEMQRSCAPD